MTVSSEKNLKQHAGNDAATVFAYDFLILDESHLLVVHADSAGTETTLTLTTDYTVSGVGVAGGGDVTLVSLVPATGETITIKRQLPLTQTTDLENGGDFYAETLETAYDKLVMMIQQVDEQTDRAMKLAVSVTGVDTELPAPTGGYLLGWSSGEDAIVNVTANDSLIYIAASAPSPDDYYLWYDTANTVLKYWNGSGWDTASGTDITGKQDRDTDAVTGNLAEFDANGHTVDAGAPLSDYAALASANFTALQIGGADVATEAYADAAAAASSKSTFYLFEGAASSSAIGTSLATSTQIATAQTIVLPTSGAISVAYHAIAFEDTGGTNSTPRMAMKVGATWFDMRSSASSTRGGNTGVFFGAVTASTTEYFEGDLGSPDMASIDAMVAVDGMATGSQSVTFGFYSDDGEAMNYRGDLVAGILLIEVIDAT